MHHGLTQLRTKGVVDYTPPARTQGYRVLQRVSDPLAHMDVRYLEQKQERELAKLERMVGFGYTRQCRRNYVLDYFGEATSRTCGRCDVCRGQIDPAFDATPAEKAPRQRRPAVEAAPIGAPKPLTTRIRRSDAAGASAEEKKAQVRARVGELFRQGMTPEAIAERLLRSITTIEDYLMALADAGEIDLSGAVSPEIRRQIEEAADRAGGDRLRPIKELLPAEISYFAIRLVLHDRVAL